MEILIRNVLYRGGYTIMYPIPDTAYLFLKTCTISNQFEWLLYLCESINCELQHSVFLKRLKQL